MEVISFSSFVVESVPFIMWPWSSYSACPDYNVWLQKRREEWLPIMPSAWHDQGQGAHILIIADQLTAVSVLNTCLCVCSGWWDWCYKLSLLEKWAVERRGGSSHTWVCRSHIFTSLVHSRRKKKCSVPNLGSVLGPGPVWPCVYLLLLYILMMSALMNPFNLLHLRICSNIFLSMKSYILLLQLQSCVQMSALNNILPLCSPALLTCHFSCRKTSCCRLRRLQPSVWDGETETGPT